MLSRDMIEKLSTPQLMQMLNNPQYTDAFPSVVAALTQRKEIKSKLAKGGKVKRFAAGGAPSSLDAASIMSQFMALGGGAKAMAWLSKTLAESGSGISAAEFLRKAPGALVGTVPQGMAASMGAVGSGGAALSGLAAGMGRNAVDMMGGQNPYGDDAGGDAGLAGAIMAATSKGPNNAVPMPTPAQAPTQAPVPMPAAFNQSGPMTPVPMPTPAATGLASAVPKARPEFNEKFPRLTLPDAPVDNTAARRKEIEAELKSEYPDQYGDYVKKLEARGADADKRYEQDKWMALLEAGLGIAGGSSPYALQNIAAGGKSGLAALRAAQESRNKTKEGAEDKAMTAKIAAQDRAMQIKNMALTMSESEFKKAMDAYNIKANQAKLLQDTVKDEYVAKRGAYEFGVNKDFQEQGLEIQRTNAANTAEANKENRELRREQTQSLKAQKDAILAFTVEKQFGPQLQMQARAEAERDVGSKPFFGKDEWEQKVAARAEVYYQDLLKVKIANLKDTGLSGAVGGNIP